LIGSGDILRTSDGNAVEDSSDEIAPLPEIKSVPRFVLQ
jgi:hypothetical protein